MKVGVRVRTEYFDLETGEPIAEHVAVREGLPGDEFDFSTREGILGPFDDFEGLSLDAAHDSICGASQKCLKAVSDSKKKQKRAVRSSSKPRRGESRLLYTET